MKRRIFNLLSILSAGLLATQSALSEELAFEFDSSAPGTFSFSVDELSTVSVELLSKEAAEYQPAYKIESAVNSHGSSGQFRVSAGSHELVISDRYNRKPVGQVSIKLHVTPESDPTEPANNDISTPRDIELGEEVDIALFPRGDFDCLRVQLPEPGYLVVKALDSADRFQLVAACTDEFGEGLGTNVIRSNFEGPITIRVSDKYDDFGSKAPLKMVTEFIPELDHDEPNNSDDQALELPLGEWREGLIAPLGDRDCFRIHVPSPGFIRYETKNEPNFAQSIEIVSAETGDKIGAGTSIPVTKGGDYIVRRSAKYSHMSLEPFLFRFTWHNDIKITPRTATEATEIEPGRRYGTTIGYENDSDRVKVSVDQLSIITFRAENGNGLEFSLPGGGWMGNPGWVRTSKPVEVVLSPKYSGWTPETVWVEANVEPEVDPAEPNDSMEEACELTVGSYQRFFYFPIRDQDWFFFEASSSGEYQVSFLSEAGARLTTELTFFDAEGKEIGSHFSPKHSTWKSNPIELDAGTYFLRHQSRFGENGITSPLHLAVHKVGEAPEMPDAQPAANTSGVYLLGVELGSTGAKLESEIENAGGSFVAVDDKEETIEKMDFVVEQIERVSPQPEKKEEKRSWWWLLVVAAAAYGADRWRRHRARQKQQDET